MKSVTETVLETVEETRQRFFDLYGKNLEDEKKVFVNWYVTNVDAPYRVQIHDLSQYYLHISEKRIELMLSQE